MSTALGVAAVTAALRQQFNELYNDPNIASSIGTTVNVSAITPSNVNLSDGDPPRLNIFLYQVSPNNGWANVDLPVRNVSGSRVNAPPLGVDLYYLITAYGQQDFEAETVLGYAMQMLHERSALGRRSLREMATSSTTDARIRTLLATSKLAEQIELIKFSMQPMSGDEISKLWTAFQSNYSPSAAYHASVVLIESEKATRSALPVREPRLHVIQLHRPRIESITPQIIEAGESITLHGNSFVSENVQIKFGGVPPLAVSPINDQEINVSLPSELKAGINTVQVLHQVDVDPSEAVEDLRHGTDSNVVAFMLAPRIVSSPIPNIAAGDILSLEISPSIDGRQRVELIIGERTLSIASRLSSSGEPITTSTLSFTIPTSFPSGTYLTRLRIDGAESKLELNSDNQYVGPEVTII